MSCDSKRQHRRINILLALLVVLAATAANAGAPAGMPPVNAPELIRPHLLDLAAPQLRPVSELGWPLRFDQARGSSATANATRHVTQTNFDVESGPQSAFVIHWARPELVIITRNFRRSGLPVVTLWHASGGARGLLALGLSPRGVPGIYFTQKVRD
jgi:hypothetical protein